VPRPGKEFIISDLSQIEPRVLAWLCGDTVLLDQLADGVPLYEAHARATMGWTGGNLKKENAELYSLAKARVLGLGYGCGPERFVEVARTMAGITISSQEATRTVESFRGSNRKITALWNQLQNDFKRSSGGDFVVELPSGRKLTYRDVRSSGGWTARVERGSRRIPFYGGKLCENCLGEGTEVLTNSGWMPIEQVGQDDLVWDGVEWVTHSGVVEQGDRETIDFGGVRVTPDHKVLTRAGWLASAETTHQEAAEYYAEA
jgi:DNA polymerase